MSIQQMMLGVGASKKTYLDDMFSTYLYKGNASVTARNNGIDLAGEGGMVWVKRRDASTGHRLTDTVRGVTKSLESNSNSAEATETGGLTAFNSNGFTVGADADYNGTNDQYSSWTFRKAPGFFDVVTFTESTSGTTAQTINHSLGCLPGMVMIKRTDGANDWWVWHKYDKDKILRLNTTAAGGSMGVDWLSVTSTSFNFVPAYIGAGSGSTWVAYVFAGGESTAATARSVDFDTGNWLTIPDHDDFTFGTTFTIEFWVKPENFQAYNMVCGQGGDFYIAVKNNGQVEVDGSRGASAVGAVPKNQWTHIAYVVNSGTAQFYVNGIKSGAAVSSVTFANSSNAFDIGRVSTQSLFRFDGLISNFRYVKGTAVYTSSFRPPTEPLTNITNTKLLCCNDSSVTGSTVTPGTITATSSPTASTDSPFDDPAAFTFGDSKEGIIKCDSYVGNGNATGPEINLGWEPQWLLIKRSSGAEDWMLFDSMRSMVSGGNDYDLRPNSTASESTGEDWVELTPTGFQIKASHDHVNDNQSTYVYMAIRRPDGYVGKLPELGTDVFAMDVGDSVSGIPNYDSTFPVDFAFKKAVAASDSWYTGARLIQGRKLFLDTTAQDTSASYQMFDSNAGWNTDGDSSSYQSWMWKRHAGFDVVTYKGTGVQPTSHRHNLSKTPEMIWIKNRDNAQDWVVWHKNLGSGGSNVNTQYIVLNTSAAETGNVNVYGGSNATAPTATHWTTGEHEKINDSSYNYIAMLFASVDGISSVGSYSGSSSDVTITTGFTPRFVLIKRTNGASYWNVFDSLRSMGSSGNDGQLLININSAQQTNKDFVNTTATGFVAKVGADGDTNVAGGEYIYYAHA